jgi:DNA polymerase-3 subunit epsilon
MGFFVVLFFIIIIFVVYKIVSSKGHDTPAGNKIKREKIELTFEDSDKTEGKYLVIDTETTGLPRNKHDRPENVDNWPYVVQLAWILFDDEGKEIEDKEYILKQKVNIPPSASEIHGITNTIMEEKGIDPKIVLTELLGAIKRVKTIVAHNIDFDLPILEAEFIRNGFEKQLQKVDKVCTMKVGKNFCKLPGAYDDYKYPTLMELFRKCFYDYASSFRPLYDKHDAMMDVLLTAKCFFRLKELNKIRK